MSANRPAPADAQDQQQQKILADAKAVIASEAFHMKRALDNNKIMEAINHASQMVSELRTSLLNPQEYYMLYMETFDELRYLEQHLYDERDKHGKKMSELYELVQYAGNIVPRLYLLITVASAYIRTKEAPVKEILRDTVEMCKGVQHPTRGLFLRNYLSEMTKDKLPDLSSDPVDGDVRDSVDFILNNFTEMNKLWVRLHMGPLREREKREAQRKALRTLVGKNLSHLNSLEGIDVDMYKETILPRVLEQVVGCHDRLAQQFLMEIVVQVFPDEFHIATLDKFLDACSKLVPRVDLKNILASLIDRLASFAQTSQSSINAQYLFETFENCIQKLGTEVATDDLTDADSVAAQTAAAAAAPDMTAAAAAAASSVSSNKPRLVCRDYLALQACLQNLCLRCFKDTPAFVDTILGNVNTYLIKIKESEPELVRETASVQQICLMLSQPVDAYNDALRVLALNNYASIGQHLVFEKRKQVQVALLQNIVDQNTAITSVENVSTVLNYVATLVRDESDKPDASSIDMDDFMDEQHLVASTVHLLENSDPEILFRMYFTARKAFGVGGKDRIIHTLPPIVFSVLRLVSRNVRPPLTEDNKKFGQTLFKFIHDTVKALQTNNYGEAALRLFLQSAHTASNCGMESFAYEFVTEAMTIYEEDIAGSAEQFAALTLIIGTLYNLKFSPENVESYETLITKAAKHSLKLMRHNDQCHAVCMSSHLFWRTLKQDPDAANVGRDGKRVLECLQKSLKIADSSMNAASNVLLFVEILNQYIYFFEHRNEFVAVKYLTSIISLINTNIAALDQPAQETTAIRAFYNNTLQYIAARKEAQKVSPSNGEPSFADITI